MSLVEINWSPTSRQLRQFGLLCVIALPCVGWLWGGHATVVSGLLAMGGLVATAAWLKPSVVRPLFIGLIVIAAPLGMLVGELAMLMIYFGIFLPIGMVFRLLRRDALQRRIDRTTNSYWQPKVEPKDAASFYRRY